MLITRANGTEHIARKLQDGYYVNLGIGIPTLVANYIPQGMEVMLQSENGLLSMGPFPTEDTLDPDLINAGKQTVTVATGRAFFDSVTSFATIRGNRVDLTVLGAFEVDVHGNIASWMILGKLIKGMGGAMDLVAGAENIIVALAHANKKGESKLLSQCELPLTGKSCIKRVVTDLGYFEIHDGAVHLKEHAPGVSIEEIQQKTAGKLVIADPVAEMKFA